MFRYGVKNKQYPWTIVDFTIGIIISIFLFSFPGFILCFYTKYYDKRKDEEFKEKFGAAQKSFIKVIESHDANSLMRIDAEYMVYLEEQDESKD